MTFDPCTSPAINIRSPYHGQLRVHHPLRTIALHPAPDPLARTIAHAAEVRFTLRNDTLGPFPTSTSICDMRAHS
jgi:hypothetical protein